MHFVPLRQTVYKVNFIIPGSEIRCYSYKKHTNTKSNRYIFTIDGQKTHGTRIERTVYVNV